MTNFVRIFTDGSAIGNPGPGGWGAVLMQGKRLWEMSGAYSWTTISEMELVAAVQALRLIRQHVVGGRAALVRIAPAYFGVDRIARAEIALSLASLGNSRPVGRDRIDRPQVRQRFAGG